MAFYFHNVGRMALPSLDLIPRQMGRAVDELIGAKPGDAVIAITLPPIHERPLKPANSYRNAVRN